MRRISTFSFIAIALSGTSFNSFAQTANCSTPTTSGTATNYYVADGSTTTIANGPTIVTYNSPISVYNFSNPPAAIPFYLQLRKIENGGNADFTAQVTIRWAPGGAQSFTCATSGTIGGPSGSSTSSASTNYYFTITPSTALPKSTTFQISVAINNTGNKQMQITGYGIDNAATTPVGGTLPVKISSLDARMISNSVSIKWNVGTEENVDGYAIEKSADGSNYSKIGFVNASGQNSYSFVDSKPASVSYYRVKSVDVNGKYAYSTVVMVKAGQSIIVLKAFPSPFTKNLSIQHTTATGRSLITVSSEDGRIVKSIVPVTGTQQTDIDLSTAKPGLYLVRFSDGNGGVETLKILKQQ